MNSELEQVTKPNPYSCKRRRGLKTKRLEAAHIQLQAFPGIIKYNAIDIQTQQKTEMF
jgi:hypothetical protein